MILATIQIRHKRWQLFEGGGCVEHNYINIVNDFKGLNSFKYQYF